MDSEGFYSQGACGEKRVTLGSSTPSFITLATNSSNPVTSNFTVKYDDSLATQADIKSYSISFDVSSVEYPADVASISGYLTINLASGGCIAISEEEAA